MDTADGPEGEPRILAPPAHHPSSTQWIPDPEIGMSRFPVCDGVAENLWILERVTCISHLGGHVGVW